MKDMLARLTSGLRPQALVQVTVPSVDRARRCIDEGLAVQQVLEAFLEISRGATAIRGEGVWLHDDGHIVREPIAIVFSHLPSRVSRDVKRRFVLRLVRFAEWAGQDALFIVVNNRAFLIRPRSRGRAPLGVALPEEAQLAAG